MYKYKPGVSRLVELSDEERDEFRSQFVAGPQHLHIVLSQITAEPELHKIDLVVRAYFWLAFSGLYEEDAYVITQDHLDFENMEIHLDGKTYPIYRQSVRTFRELASATSMRRRTKLEQNGKLFPRAEGDQLLRTFSKTYQEEMRVLYHRAMRGCFNSDGTPVQLNFKTVYSSGIFFRTFEMERVTGRYDFKQEISDYFERRYKHKEMEIGQRKIGNNKECTLKLDYCKWKTAFPVS